MAEGNKSRKRAKTARKRATSVPPLVPQENGRGALYAGGVPGNAGGTGRPRDEIRAWLRDITWQKLPEVFSRWKHLDHEQQVALLERIALKYGVGTLSETLTPEDYAAKAQRFMAEAMRQLVEVEGVAKERVDAAFQRALDAMQRQEAA